MIRQLTGLMGSAGLLGLMNGGFLSGNWTVSMRQVATAVTKGTLVIICSKWHNSSVQSQVGTSFSQPFSVVDPSLFYSRHSALSCMRLVFMLIQFQTRLFILISEFCTCSFCSISYFLWDGNKYTPLYIAHLLSVLQKEGCISCVVEEAF